MTFLLPSQVEMTPPAASKLLAEIPDSPDEKMITTLMWTRKMTDWSKEGEVLSEKHNLFTWGFHNPGVVPQTAIWTVEGVQFALQDGRWKHGEALRLGVVDGEFLLEPKSAGNAN